MTIPIDALGQTTLVDPQGPSIDIQARGTSVDIGFPDLHSARPAYLGCSGRTDSQRAISPMPRVLRRIRRVFEAVATRCDLMNDLMSAGIHRLWKWTLVRMAAPAAGQCIVHHAGGTGDVAARMAAPDRQVIVCDPSLGMMAVGRDRGRLHLHSLEGRGECIPLPSASVDTLTIAFGIRNVTRIDAALDAVIPRLDAWIAQAPEACSYLVESIRRFRGRRAYRSLIEQAGFVDVSFRNLSWGVAAIHTGTRPAAA